MSALAHFADSSRASPEVREWDGPAALPPPTTLRVLGGLVRRRSTPMPRASTVHAVIAIGIDLGKSTLHMIGLDSCGAIVLREKVSRGRIASRLANLPPCLIGIEAEWRHTMLLVLSDASGWPIKRLVSKPLEMP